AFNNFTLSFLYRTIKAVADIYEYAMSYLKEKAWLCGERRAKKRLLHQYHSSVDEKTEMFIVENFTRYNSNIRFLISTIAFGMGIQVDDIEIVIHWGVSKTVLSYWQEVGRCGRSGRRSEAYLYATMRSLDKRHTTDEVIKLCASLNEACIRWSILKCLLVEGMDTSSLDALEFRDECKGVKEDDDYNLGSCEYLLANAPKKYVYASKNF
ncbi:uncharacterized protein LOC144344631, partial [Saccoglossus kowalevskii]